MSCRQDEKLESAANIDIKPPLKVYRCRDLVQSSVGFDRTLENIVKGRRPVTKIIETQ